MNLNAYDSFHALIFDMDGTLVDSGQLHEKAWIETLDHYQIPVDRSLMRSLAGVPTPETVDALATHFGISLIQPAEVIARDKIERVRSNMLQQVKPTALAEVVKHYHGKKPMAVGTGASTKEALAIIDACGLSDYFEVVVGGDAVENPKPAPDTFLSCATKLGVIANECVVFEDAPLGIQAAQQAGMACVDVAQELNIHNDYFLTK